MHNFITVLLVYSNFLWKSYKIIEIEEDRRREKNPDKYRCMDY
jgi:hypothetical protein